jgi:hypothetical protein
MEDTLGVEKGAIVSSHPKDHVINADELRLAQLG